MALPVVYVKAEGHSWQYNVEHGFSTRVVIALRTSNISSFTGLPAKPTIVEVREAVYRRYRKTVGKLFEKRKVDWNMRSWKHTHMEAYVYCRDLTWIAMLRLYGHEEMYQNIMRIEQLEGTTCPM